MRFDAGREEGSTVFVSDEHFAVEHFVVPEDIVEHFLVEISGWRLESYFHAAGFLNFEVDIAGGSG